MSTKFKLFAGESGAGGGVHLKHAAQEDSRVEERERKFGSQLRTGRRVSHKWLVQEIGSGIQ